LVANTSGSVQVILGRAVITGDVGGAVGAGVVGAGITAITASSAGSVVGTVEGEARIANLALGRGARVATGAV
jgi:hypothetical protein